MVSYPQSYPQSYPEFMVDRNGLSFGHCKPLPFGWTSRWCHFLGRRLEADRRHVDVVVIEQMVICGW